MSISIAELAELPTAPTISHALRDAAIHADQGIHQALRRSLFGSVTFEDFAATVTPEHVIAEGIALIIIGGLVDPDVTDQGWPDSTWNASYFSQRVHQAHIAATGWAASHTTQQLAHLLEAAADRAKTMEAAA
ncbi:hypothetical protein [Streptomyces sp. NBC_00356]|uniref:hypothetical protein n=1 Tax=Streptomyces sp. NBC_00356 TaxID=2975724 RepID=UPI002E25D4B0